MAKEKEPHWMGDQAPPGFAPDGASLILPPGTKPKWPEQKVVVDGVEMTVDEYEKREREADEVADDLGGPEDLDDLDRMIGGGG